MTTFIELGAGIGGFRLAFEAVGAECVYAVERDYHACRTYRANFGEQINGDVYQPGWINVIPDHDILTSGFPCQPYSVAGKMRGLSDRKNGRFFWAIKEVLHKKQPKAFLLENVPHLKNHRHFERIMIELMREGYAVSYNVLPADRYVPQKRNRLFIVGFRESHSFDWPVLPERRETHLYHILEPEVDPKYLVADEVLGYKSVTILNITQRNYDVCTRTLAAGYGKDGKEILVVDHIYNQPRRLTPRECARLMGFPDSFQIPVTDRQAYMQFGNAVVVPLVEDLARAMLEAV